MNTLEDLRRDLAAHAGDVVDHELGARPAAVRHRVAVVRRRRRTAVAGAALAAIVAGGSLTTVLSQPDQGPEVLGQRAPATLTSLGWTYRATGETWTFDRRGAITLAPSDEPRLVSWTTDRTSSVHVLPAGGDEQDSTASRFSDFVLVPAHQRGRILFRVDTGRVGVAAYDLTDAVPAGVTRDGITFRDTVADTPLLGAAIGEQGQAEVTTTVTAPRGQVGVAYVCSGLPKGAMIHLSFNGHDRLATGCEGRSDTFDPGARQNSRFHLPHPGQPVELRMWVSKGVKDLTPYAGDLGDVRLGFGLYGPVVQRRVGGFAMPTTIEHGGHTWLMTDSNDTDGTAIRVSGPSEAPRLLAIGWGAGPQGLRQYAVTAGGTTQRSDLVTGSTGGAIGEIWVPAGPGGVRVQQVRGHGGFGIGLYERVD